MQKISATIITYNEQESIGRCINSITGIADEIIVVDSYSGDRTPEICKNLGVRFIQNKFAGYIEQKKFALRQASNDYILSIDADEALSDELRRSILKEKNNLNHDGYLCSRLDNYCGKWMYNTALLSHNKLRLFNRNKGCYSGINPHDTFKLTNGASTGRLKGYILHWGFKSLEEHMEKIEHFSTISAREYFKLDIKAGYSKIVLNPIWKFIHSYIIKGGVMSGYKGYLVSRNMAVQCYLKYSKLRKLHSATSDKTKKYQRWKMI